MLRLGAPAKLNLRLISSVRLRHYSANDRAAKLSPEFHQEFPDHLSPE
jgi:hypothetical protein